MKKVKVYLKSGQTMVVKCKEAHFTYDTEKRTFTGFKFTGLKKSVIIDPTQISAFEG